MMSASPRRSAWNRKDSDSSGDNLMMVPKAKSDAEILKALGGREENMARASHIASLVAHEPSG